MANKTKKKETLSPEDKFYATFSEMSKVNFLGTMIKKYFQEKIIGKDENSLEYAEIKAIIRVLNDKFAD